MCVILSDAGYRAIGAADGAEAMRYLRAGSVPSMILLDLMMPNMNGWEFRAAQQSDPELANICIAVMTANRDVIDAAGFDASHFLWKPITMADVLRVVDECCGHVA